jgi:ATP-dependent DNA ligase
MVVIPDPMLARESLHPPFSDPDWIYEIKHDGYRCLAAVDPGVLDDPARVRLRTKGRANCTAWFPEIARGLACIPGGPHIIDGEAAVIGEHGVSDFNALQERARKRRWYKGAPQVTFCAFDLLMQDGQDLTQEPLTERKARLEQLLACSQNPDVLVVGMLPAEERVFHAMVAAGLKIEGLVAKRKDSTYRPGQRTDDWVKIKRPGWQEGRKWRG